MNRDDELIVRMATALSCTFDLGLMIWIVVTSFVMPVVSSYRNQQDDVADAQQQLVRYQTIASNTDELSKRIADLNAAEFESYFLRPATTPTIAVAAIQGDLRNWVGAQGGKVVSSQGRPTSQFGKNLRVPVLLTFNGDVSVLNSVLYQIEMTQPYLVVDSLSIKQTRMSGKNTDQNPILDVTLGVSGFIDLGAGTNG